MDIMARALLAADRLLSESPIETMRKERYASYDSGEGKAFELGQMSLEQACDYARSHSDLESISGKQELYEAIVNMYI